LFACINGIFRRSERIVKRDRDREFKEWKRMKEADLRKKKEEEANRKSLQQAQEEMRKVLNAKQLKLWEEQLRKNDAHRRKEIQQNKHRVRVDIQQILKSGKLVSFIAIFLHSFSSSVV
jgi:uncharacterized membrane protein YqiK